jgi:hypothetical protein
MNYRLDWAFRIAKEVASGQYKGGGHGARMAAEAIRNCRQPVPESLQPYLPARKSANDDNSEAA